MKKKLLILFCLLPVLLSAKGIELYDGFLYSELDGKYSSNSNIDNSRNATVQQLEIKLRMDVTPKIKLYGMFVTEFVQFEWKKENRHFLFGSLGAKYMFNSHSELKLGSLTVNYSPYLIFSYPWYGDIFRGIEYKYDALTTTAEVFVANNSESVYSIRNGQTIYSNLIEKYYDNTYNFINLGYNAQKVYQDSPTIWAGAFVRKQFRRDNLITPEIKLMGLFENFKSEDVDRAWAKVYKNFYAAGNAALSCFNWMDLGFYYAVEYSQYDRYNIKLNYFGNKMDFYSLTNSYHPSGSRLPDAFSATLNIRDFYGRFLGTSDLNVYAKYENIHSDYNPLYMQGNVINERGFNLPGSVALHGRINWTIRGIQKLPYGFSVGYGYADYKMNNHLQEKSYYFYYRLSEKLRTSFIWYDNRILEGSMPDGLTRLDSCYVSLESDIISNLSVSVFYIMNANYYKGFNELKIQLMMWGW